MNKTTKYILITVAVILVLAIAVVQFFISGINKVIALDENVKKSWAEVDNQLQRRYDLIPNLVETVKGYAKQEKEIFVEVAKARSQVGRAATIDEKISANNALSGALSRLLLVVERYPELKSNQNFIRLQDELAGTENRISVARMRYNESVKELNTYIRKIPGVIFARIAGIKNAPYYEIKSEAKETPKVKF
ncbi:MAG: LemA family protein [Candidatus Schekmanbacteria bacterium]|nr:MAG: LemA family protein [Candidatus Schekmanbacteria bacterium]